MKDCPECGGPNPNFKGKPNVFCNGPECKGRIPLAHAEPDEIIRKEGGAFEVPKVKACYNCGSDHDLVLVNG